MAIENYIGKGITFPIEISSLGGPVIKTGFDLVNSSIKNILMWPRNQRIFLSQYGSPLSLLVEEPNDILLSSLASNFVTNTLKKWEKRITIIEVRVVNISAEKLDISLTYKLTKSNLEETFVFPFYRNIIY